MGLVVLIAAVPQSSTFATRSLPNFGISDGSTVTVFDPNVSLLLAKPRASDLLKRYENAHSLTDRELVELLKAVGFEGKSLRVAWAVAKAESNGRPKALNDNERTGDNSYGIFQINMIGNLGVDRRERYDLKSNRDLFSPVVNAQITYKMTNGGADWSSWTSYTKGAIHRWLDKFPNI